MFIRRKDILGAAKTGSGKTLGMHVSGRLVHEFFFKPITLGDGNHVRR